MNPRICICCGEPMAERGNAFSRNPNMCASCSSLADGLEQTNGEQDLNAPPEAEAWSTAHDEEPVVESEETSPRFWTCHFGE